MIVKYCMRQREHILTEEELVFKRGRNDCVEIEQHSQRQGP